jgi:hypothetical protein
MKIRSLGIVAIFGLATCLSLSSCAYKLRRGGLTRGVGDIDNASIFVPVIDNLSTEVGPEAVLTGSVREAMATLQGVDVVNSQKQARFVLRGRIKRWGRNFGTPTTASSAAAEAAGGLIENQTSAADIKVSLVADFELLELVSPGTNEMPILRNVWKREFRSEGSFEAYNRFDERSGSSSAPFINRSRENLQLRKLSDNIARQIIDQVSQDF